MDWLDMLKGILPGANPMAAQQPGGAPPAQAPASGNNFNTANLVQPMQFDPSAAHRQVAVDKLGQLSAILLAAGQRQTSGQRAQVLSGIGDVLGSTGRDIHAAYQTQHAALQAQKFAQDQVREEQLRTKMADPKFLQGIGINPQLAETLGPEGIRKVVELQAARNPLDDQVKRAQLDALTKPKWETTGYDEYGKPRRDLTTPDGQIITPAAQAAALPITEQVRGLSGMDVITKLKEKDPGLASQVDAIASGRVPYPSTLLKTPRGEVISDLVNMVDPNYSAATYGNRKKLTDSASNTTLGSMGGQITFGNTAIKHLGGLYEMVDELGNHGGFPGSNIANRVGNAMLKSAGKGATLNRWEATATNAADEIAKFYGAGGVTEREKLKELFDSARSPQELKAVIEESIRDIHAKTSNLQNQWQETMGPYSGSKKFIYDDTQKVVDRIMGGEKPAAAPAAPATSGAPNPGDVIKGHRFKGGNPADPNSWEKVQ